MNIGCIQDMGWIWDTDMRYQLNMDWIWDMDRIPDEGLRRE